MNINATSKAIEEAVKKTLAYTQVNVRAHVSEEDTHICMFTIEIGYAKTEKSDEKIYYVIELTVQEYSRKQKVIWIKTSSIGMSITMYHTLESAIESVPVAK